MMRFTGVKNQGQKRSQIRSKRVKKIDKERQVIKGFCKKSQSSITYKVGHMKHKALFSVSITIKSMTYRDTAYLKKLVYKG